MKAAFTSGKWGYSFICRECGAELEQVKDDDDMIRHPAEEYYYLKKKPIHCRYAGKTFVNPFRNIELAESAQPPAAGGGKQ